MTIKSIGTITSHEERKYYFAKIMLLFLMFVTLFFAILNLSTMRFGVGFYNLFFCFSFSILYYYKDKNLDLILSISGFFCQIFFFIHSYYLLPGKQIEGAIGAMTCMLPVLATGFRLWFFFISNFILYHIVLFSVGYGDIFYFQYSFYIFIFAMIYTIINTNKQYEKELIVQRDKIKRDAEALKEIDELKTRFFANISHELRTPLTLVLSPLESILNSNELSNKNFTYLSLVQQNAQKLLKRINELLELSKLDAKRLEIVAQPNNLYQITKQITALYEGAANLKSITLNYINKIPETRQNLWQGSKI